MKELEGRVKGYNRPFTRFKSMLPLLTHNNYSYMHWAHTHKPKYYSLGVGGVLGSLPFTSELLVIY